MTLRDYEDYMRDENNIRFWVEEDYDCDRCGREFIGNKLTEEEVGNRQIVCRKCADELAVEHGASFHDLYVSP